MANTTMAISSTSRPPPPPPRGGAGGGVEEPGAAEEGARGGDGVPAGGRGASLLNAIKLVLVGPFMGYFLNKIKDWVPLLLLLPQAQYGGWNSSSLLDDCPYPPPSVGEASQVGTGGQVLR